jgi:hypothetical protein
MASSLLGPGMGAEFDINQTAPGYRLAPLALAVK